MYKNTRNRGLIDDGFIDKPDRVQQNLYYLFVLIFFNYQRFRDPFLYYSSRDPYLSIKEDFLISFAKNLSETIKMQLHIVVTMACVAMLSTGVYGHAYLKVSIL